MAVFASPIAELDLVIRDDWGAGFIADLALTPSGSLNGWTVAFDFAGEIVNIWNARVVSRSGDRYVVESVGYNDAVPSGATASFGFQGAGASGSIAPISINGAVFGDDAGAPVPTLPSVLVADASAAEEDGEIVFDLSLSAPASAPVEVAFETVAGSAVAGDDFVAKTGSVVFAAGQTAASVAIALNDDAAAEATERFELRLTSATGAQIADAVATGTLSDGDVAPDPDPLPDPTPDPTPDPDPAPAPPSAGGGLLPDGPLSTAGAQIVDAQGLPVQIRAVNWFGAENAVRAPHGLWARPMTEMMDQMAAEGFNAIRLPFSVQNILEDLPATSVAGDPSLAGLTTLEIFDRIIAYAEQIGLKIILDAHRVTQGDGAEGIWYAGAYDEGDWVDAWRLLAERYGDSNAVIAADLLNEPHLGTWGTGQRDDWAAAAEMAGDAVLDIAPDWLILVEGIGSYQGDSYWWGGQLQGVRDRPVVLSVDDKLVYSPHDYPASVFQQPWFTDGSDLYEVFRENWGFIFEDGIAPVLLGEFGSRLQNPLDLVWADAITTYLSGDFDGDGTNDLADGAFGPSFAWWSWNPNSGDTGGYVLDDWTTVRPDAAELLAPLLSGAAVGSDPVPADPDPVGPDPVDPDPVGPDPVDPDPVDPAPVDPPADGGGAGDGMGGEPPATPDYELAVDDWGSGFTARFFLTPETAVSGGWTLRVATSATVNNVWNAEVVGQQDGVLTLRNAPWNGAIAAGETIEVGFQGVGSAQGLDLIDTTIGIDGGAEDPGDGMGGGDGGMGGGAGDGGEGSGGPDGGSGGGSGPFVGGGTTYQVGQIAVVTGFDPTRDVLDLGPPSIHNQIPVDTPDGFMMLHMFNPGFSTLVEGVWLADLHPENFAPIADGHLQQDMSAILAYEDGSGLVRPNTVYARSHEEGVVEVVDFDPATDKLSFFYLSVRGDGGLNFRAEQTAEGARFWNPLTGQSLTLRDVDFADLDSSHFEWRANQLEDGIAGRMGLEALIDGFSYPPGNVFSGKSVAMAGLVDRAPYHSQPDYTGTPIGAGSDDGGTGDGGSSGGGSGGDGSGGDGSGDAPVVVTVTGGSVTEADPGMAHVHGDGSSHMHDDGHRYITFTVSLEAPAAQELRLTYATADVTAVADATSSVAWDYHAASGELVFAPGDRTKTVAVAVHPDMLVEDTETFSFQVSGENLTGTLEATGTIYDDDVHDVPPLIAQAGETAFVQQGADAWTQVLFDAAMVDPIVTLGPLSRKGAHEATLRVRNVTSHGFEIQVDEWDHLDGWHTGETVSWLAVERGTHRLADGAMLQAGRSDASHDWTRIDFDAGFADVMVLGSVSSDRTPNAVTERFRDLSADGVSVALQKQEASDGTTAVESFDWVAFELGGFDAFTAVRDGTTVSDALTAVTLDAPLADDQAFFAEMQTTRGKDAATLRLNAFDGQTATLFVEEETSRDDEKRHLHEEIAWLTIDDAIHAAGHAAAPPDPGGMEATLFHFDEIKSGAYVASDNAEFPEITATTHLVQSNDFGRAGYDGHDWGGIDPNMYRGFDYAGRDREIGEAVGAGPVIQVDPGMSTQQIEDAIDAAPAGATVEFLDGTYWLTETLNIDRGDLHVKGQSEAGVILRADAVTDDAAIRVSDGIRAKLTPDEVKLVTEATAPVSAEDRSVVLTSVAGIEPGDFIEFVYNYDADLNTRVDVGDSFNKLSSLVEVAMVHPEMNMVMLREKAGMDYDPNRSVGNSEVRVYDKDDFIHDLVISDLTIRYAEDAEYQSIVDPHDLFNYNNQTYGGDYAHKVAGIRLEGVHETDIVNVTVDNAASLGIWIDAGYQVGIRNYAFDGAQNLGGGGNGYGILLDDSFYGDFEGLTMGRTDADGNIYATRHAVVFGYSSSGAYNNTQIDFTNSNIDFHGAADYGNIYYVQEMDMVRMDHYNFGAMDDRFALDGLRYNQIQNTYVFDDVRAHEEGPIPGYVGSLVPGQEDGQGHWANNGVASPYEDIVYMSAAGGEARTFGKDDEIHGGVGADSLWGGDGDDDFLMYANSGVDAIHDFEDGDRVGVASNVNGAGIFDAGDVAARLAQVGDDSLLDLGGGNHVLLIGVQSASLSPQDFFVF